MSSKKNNQTKAPGTAEGDKKDQKANADGSPSSPPENEKGNDMPPEVKPPERTARDVDAVDAPIVVCPACRRRDYKVLKDGPDWQRRKCLVCGKEYKAPTKSLPRP